MYSFYEYLAFFVIYAFLGWCAEVIFNTINTGHFVNRGFLSGPVCPIYGFGMVIVVFCLTPLQLAAVVFWLHVFDQRAGMDHRLRAEKGVSHQLVGLFQSAF